MTSFITRCPHCQAQNRIATERREEHAVCGKCKRPLMDGAPITLTQDNFAALTESEQPIVVDFWAEWCGPCKQFSPVFSAAAEQNQGKLRFGKINTEHQQALAAQFAIRSIPTLMVFKQGEVVAQLSGALPPAQFQQWLDQNAG
ncbi:thioredoxin TrxC [Aliagarivorans taiwanensis]|uniref:thioredoxin TrxC n=1 Tax=Aliagarivorans taiwanensis TaxID=561966 RepID=UPI00042A7F36|nr:thioredoxin TrxC [Aliagarivorans taiwanensis]